MNIISEENKVSGSKLAHLGRRVFPRRLTAGLSAVVLAALFVTPTTLTLVRGLGSITMILGGLALRAWAAACAGNHTRDATISASRLVTRGAYSLVRNPIYLGTIVLGAGMVWLIGDPKLAPLLILACVFLYTTIIPAEEQFLAAKFGDEFQAYRNSTPQILPRIRFWNSFQNSPREWANARGEIKIAALLPVIYWFLRASVWLRD